jgi:uncharacterized protein YjdB
VRACAAGALLVAAIVGCSKDSKQGTAPPPVTYTIAITAPDSTVRVGQTSQLTATLTRSDGLPASNGNIEWSSSDTTIASVSTSGLLSAKAAGSVSVTASSNGVSANTGIRIVPTPRDNAAKIVAESTYVGQTIDLRAYLLDNGTPEFTDSTTWTSSDPTVGTIAGGVFTALKSGLSSVTATRGIKVGVVDVLAQTHVKALALAPDTLDIPFLSSAAFDVIATDSAGKRIYGRAVTWSVSDTSKLKVNGDFLTPKAGGITTVTAVSEGAVATAVVRVTAPPGYAIYLTTPQSWVSVGKTLQINSESHDPSTFFYPVASLSWSSSDSTIARVSSSGLVTGIARGKATITARAGGQKGTIDVNVEKPVASVAFVPDTVLLAIHGSLPLSASLRDADGNALTARPLSWTSSDTSIVSLTISNNAAGANARGVPGAATVSGSVDGVAGSLNVMVTSGTDQMYFDYAGGGAGSYSTFDTHVYAHDASGAPISGRGVRIVSSDQAILSVQPDTAAFANGAVTLHVTAGHGGDAALTATSGSVSANYLVHVAPVSVAVKIAYKPGELPVGKTYRLTTNVLQHEIDWSTSDATVATVSDSGLVTPLAGGIVRIVATARDALPPSADTATIGIRAQLAPLVTAISPTELQAGGSATLTGQNFQSVPSANTVTIDGVPAQVTAASTTQLSVTLPAMTSFPCQATHVAMLVVSTGPGLVTASQQLFATSPQQSLAVGDADLWSPADSRCNELAKGHGVYLLTISNGGTPTDPWTGFSFMVDTGSVASATVASGARIPIPTFSRSLQPVAPRAGPAPGVLRINMDSLRRAAIAHRNLLDKSRNLASRLGSPLPALRRALRSRVSADVVATSSVPDTGTKMFIRVPRLDTPEFCGDYRTIQARVVYTGAHSIILEDVQSPAAGLMDDYYRSVGAEFDQTTYNIITSNFGDPMAMDQSLGGPGRVTMVFTPAVNEMGPTGFVVSCDFYPADVVPSSNQREMFYAVVPTTTALGFNGAFTRDVWKHIIRGTIAHETKHIASMAEHFARQTPRQEESWLEEGTAMHAMELWARTVTQMRWKGANNYASAPYCDVRPTWQSCAGQPYTMFDHFLYLHDFLTPSEQHTPLGSTDPYDGSFYGSVWWLVRWAIDQYATDEGAFLRALTQEPSLTGIANLSARTGRPWSDMIRDWSLATLTSYQAPAFTPHDRRLTTPTWQLRNVLDGIANDFPSEFGGNGMLTYHGQYCATSPTVIHAMPPGGISFYYLDTCDGWKNFFRFQSDAGGSPSSALSIGVVRIQ